nr:hypothetical protein [Angustibacter aerolatus]
MRPLGCSGCSRPPRRAPSATCRRARRPRSGAPASPRSLLRRVLDRRDVSAVARVAAPTTAGVAAGLDAALPARLVHASATPVASGRTVVAAGVAARTVLGVTGGAALVGRGTSPAALAAVGARTDALLAGQGTVADGEVLVLEPAGRRPRHRRRAPPTGRVCRRFRARAAARAGRGGGR